VNIWLSGCNPSCIAEDCINTRLHDSLNRFKCQIHNQANFPIRQTGEQSQICGLSWVWVKCGLVDPNHGKNVIYIYDLNVEVPVSGGEKLQN
jgi:hypothetical protein